MSEEHKEMSTQEIYQSTQDVLSEAIDNLEEALLPGDVATDVVIDDGMAIITVGGPEPESLDVRIADSFRIWCANLALANANIRLQCFRNQQRPKLGI